MVQSQHNCMGKCSNMSSASIFANKIVSDRALGYVAKYFQALMMNLLGCHDTCPIMNRYVGVAIL